MLQGVNPHVLQDQPSSMTLERFQHGDVCAMMGDVKGQLRTRRRTGLALLHTVFTQRVRQAVQEVTSNVGLILRDEGIRTGCHSRDWGLPQVKGECSVVKCRVGLQPKVCQVPEQFAHPIQLLTCLAQVHTQPRMDVFIEVLQQLVPGIVHPRLDCLLQVCLESIKRSIDLSRRPARLIDVKDASLEVDSRLDCPQDLVRGTKHAREQVELLCKQLQNTFVCLVLLIEEVD